MALTLTKTPEITNAQIAFLRWLKETGVAGSRSIWRAGWKDTVVDAVIRKRLVEVQMELGFKAHRLSRLGRMTLKRLSQGER